jgi:hypothetical protein
LALVLKGTAVSPSLVPGCLLVGKTVVLCSRLFGACALFNHPIGCQTAVFSTNAPPLGQGQVGSQAFMQGA